MMNISEVGVQKIWNIVSATGLLLGIVASIISIVTFLRVDKIEELVRRAKDWKIVLDLSEPQNGAEMTGPVIRIAGRTDFRTTAIEVESNPRVNLALAQNQVELVPFVRPVSEAKWWWVQPSPVVRQDGSFEGSVFIGESGGAGIGIKFQIVVLAVPKGSVREGDKLVNLPFSYAASNIVTVKRIH